MERDVLRGERVFSVADDGFPDIDTGDFDQRPIERIREMNICPI